MTRIPYKGPGELYIRGIDGVREQLLPPLDQLMTVCQESVESHVPKNVDYSFYCMRDGDTGYGGDNSYRLFQTATNTLYRALLNDERVLVHCHVGRSRSVSVATAALSRLTETPPAATIAHIYGYRTVADPIAVHESFKAGEPCDEGPKQLLREHIATYHESYQRTVTKSEPLE